MKRFLMVLMAMIVAVGSASAQEAAVKGTDVI